MGHALQAGAVERAATLVEGNVLTLLDHRELTTLMGWLELLSENVIRSRPWLCVATAWVLTYTGCLDEVVGTLASCKSVIGGVD